jgi:hypothetical protein
MSLTTTMQWTPSAIVLWDQTWDYLCLDYIFLLITTSYKRKMAEGVGFEPTVPVRHNGFRDY